MDLAAMALERRLKRIEDRLSTIEQRLGTPITVARPTDVPPPISCEPILQPAQQAARPPVLPPSDWPTAQVLPRTPAPQPTARPDTTARSSGLEQLVGARLYAALGAIVVTVGAGMFLKLAVDHGWFNVSPTTRCSLAAGFGALLAMLGEVLRRRLNTIATASLSAAGLGTIYASAWAAFGMYRLVSPGAAFVMLAAISVLGVLLALRAGLVSLALLSIGGAYIAMLVVPAGTAPYWMSPMYLLAILGLGLWLSAARPSPFRLVRPLVLAGTGGLGAAVTLGLLRDAPMIGLTFLGMVWLLVHIELYIGSRRLPAAVGELRTSLHRSSFASIRPVTWSFAATAWSVGLGVLLARLSSSPIPIDEWVIPAAGFLGTFVGSLLFAAHLRVLRDTPATDSERLGAGLLMQSGALLIGTVALAFAGWAEVVAWLAMGLAAAVAGRWMRSRALAVYGMIPLTISVARLITYDLFVSGITANGVDVVGLYLTRWSVLMAGAAIAWLISGLLLRAGASGKDQASGERRWRDIGAAMIGIGVCLFGVAAISPQSAASSLALVVVMISVSTMLTGRAIRSVALGSAGALGLCLVTGLLSIAQSVWPYPFSRSTAFAGLLFTPWSVPMVVTGLAWCGVAWGLRPLPEVFPGAARLSSNTDPRRSIALALGLLTPLWMLVVEGVSMTSLCLVWTLAALLIGLAHRLRPTLSLRTIATIAMGGALVVWMVKFPAERLGGRIDGGALLMHPSVLLAVFLVASMSALARLWSRWSTNRDSAGLLRAPDRAFILIHVVAAVLLGFLSSTIEVRRDAMILLDDATARQAAVSIWWGLFAAGLLAVGFVRRVPLVRHAGLGLLGIATIKAALLDLQLVGAEWRALTFLGLGMLMLAVAVVYARMAGKLGEARGAQEGGTPG